MGSNGETVQKGIPLYRGELLQPACGGETGVGWFLTLGQEGLTAIMCQTLSKDVILFFSDIKFTYYLVENKT